MGLDMYLTAERYLTGADYYGEERQAEFWRVVEAGGAKDSVDPEWLSAELSVTVGYWRKANAIHKWFVDKVQDGVDECQHSYVTREQLAELRDACRKVMDSTKLVPGKVYAGTTYSSEGTEVRHEEGRVLEDDAVAEALLPAADGFFFGYNREGEGTNYDEWYWQSLERTVEAVDRALAMPDPDDEPGWSFYYRSSW